MYHHSRGFSRLPMCRLPPQTFHILALSLSRHWTVPASYWTQTSYRWHFPSVPLSQAVSRAHPLSSVVRGRRSWPRSHSHSCRSPSAIAGSSQEGLPRESSRRSHRSRSPSSTSSRDGSASPDGSRRHSRSHLRSPSRRADEDRQEQQSLLDFVLVVATLQSLNELPEAPSENHKISGSLAALEDNDQSASSYRLPVGFASGGHSL